MFHVQDEPTNYLDRDSLGALADSIKVFEGGVVMISHNNGAPRRPQCHARGLVCLCLDLEPSVAAAAHRSVLCWTIPTYC